MTNNLKIEVLVSNIPEDGSIASQFPSQEYVNQQLAKKANLSPEGRLDPSHAPDYTEIPGLYEHIEDTKDVIETSIADSLQDAKGYTNQQLSTSLQTKADLVNGKIPFDQIPFSADIEDQIQINVENITAVVDQKVAQVVEQVNGVATAANSYTDTKVAETKTYVDTTVGNVIEDVERLGVSKAVTIPTYLTPEAGVAVGTGVAAGAYFNVRSTEDDTALVEYQNVGGTATPTGKSYPSSQVVKELQDGYAIKKYLLDNGVVESELNVDYDFLMQRLAQVAVDKGLDASFVVDGNQSQHDINNRTTRQIANISELKNRTPLENGQIIEVIDYDENVQGVFNKYIYRASSNLVDNHGTVISPTSGLGRWLMLPKPEYVPEDFGVASGDFIATNTAKITAYLQSGLSLYIPAKKYIAHATFLSVNISKTTRIIGESMTDSILEKLQIITSGNCDSSEFKNFRINTLSMNYSIYVNGGSYMQFENVYTYHNYDGICFYNNTGTKLKRNTVKNCIAEKSGRVGFTTDIGGEDTIFENLTAIDCKQAYHFEGCKDSKLRNSKAISCGSGSSLSSGEQDVYAGPLRSYYVDGLIVDGLENITPVGTSQWQHGGGLNSNAVNSNDLVFKNLVNCGALILDEEIAKTRNATFENIDQLAIYTTGFKQKFTGKVIVENCAAPLAGIDGLMISGADLIDIKETVAGRLQLAANKIRTHNLTAKTSYFHVIEAVDFKATGILENIQTSLGDPGWHHGFAFDMINCVRLVCDTLRLSGIGTGWHLVLVGIGATTKEIELGDLQEDVSTAYRINDVVYGNKDVFSEFGIQYNSRRTFRRDTITTSGTYRVGDMILKNTIAADTIYGWICSTGGTGAAVVWKPLKYAV